MEDDDLELYVKDLKAKFEDIAAIVYNDEEELTNKEFSSFAEEMLELNHEMIQHIRTLTHRVTILERAAKFDGLSAMLKAQEESPGDPPSKEPHKDEIYL